jgi:hypothetical protein
MIHSCKPARVVVPMGLAVCLSLFGDLTLYAVLVTQLDLPRPGRAGHGRVCHGR